MPSSSLHQSKPVLACPYCGGKHISKNGVRKNKYGADFYGQIGKKGGQTTSDRHGPEFYEKIGKKGGQRVKELIERAKAAEGE